MDMNKRSKYWNSSADEAIGAYRKKLGLTQIALILMILSVIALAWGRIFTDAVGADLYWASILAILFCAFGIRLYKQILLGRLLAILYTDCDPVKFVPVARFLQSLDRKGKGRITLGIYLCQGLYYAGDFRGAAQVLSSLTLTPRTQPVLAAIYYNMAANLDTAMGYIGRIPGYREAVRSLYPQNKPNSSLAKTILACLDILDACQMEQNGDTQGLRQFLDRQLTRATHPFQAVTVRFKLGRICLASGERESARNHLKFAARYGGTMYQAKEARELLAQMDH